MFCFNYTCFLDTSRKVTYKMNKIVNKLLLVGDKIMPENAFKTTLIKTRKEFKN